MKFLAQRGYDARRQKEWQKKVSSNKYVAAASRGGRRAIIYNDVDITMGKDVAVVCYFHPQLSNARADCLAPEQPANTKYEQLGAFTLKELKEHKQASGTVVFRPVVARIVDFYPEKPEQFVILRCTKCLSEYAQALVPNL